MKREIIAIEKVAKDCFRLTIRWETASSSNPQTKPGQFVMMRVSSGNMPLLRRPMSIASESDSQLSVILKVIGEGSKILSQKHIGDFIDVDGAYGNYFTPPDDLPLLLVGGGVGIPPLLFFASRNSHRQMTAILGGASKQDLFGIEELKHMGVKVITTTIDGSHGLKGMVTEPLLKEIKTGSHFMLACGPNGMLHALDNISKEFNLQGQISTEAQMGCGFGVCLGCMVNTTKGNKRVCKEGPVFGTGQIIWK